MSRAPDKKGPEFRRASTSCRTSLLINKEKRSHVFSKVSSTCLLLIHSLQALVNSSFRFKDRRVKKIDHVVPS